MQSFAIITHGPLLKLYRFIRDSKPCYFLITLYNWLKETELDLLYPGTHTCQANLLALTQTEAED